jgi:hypothetical protein
VHVHDLGVGRIDLAFNQLAVEIEDGEISGFKLSKELVAVSRIVSVLGTRTLKLPWWLIEIAPVRTSMFALSITA